MLMMLMMITNVIDRQWTVVAGVSGLWSLVSGLWSLVSGGLWWSVLLHSSLCATPSVRRELYKVRYLRYRR